MALASVAIILVNWNGKKDLLECLEALTRLDYPHFNVIVCDNNSQDGSGVAVDNWARGGVHVSPESAHYQHLFDLPRRVEPSDYMHLSASCIEGSDAGRPAQFVFIDTGANLGFAGGNNVGIRYAQAKGGFDYYWLLNTDTIPSPDALSALVRRAQARPDAGQVGSSLIYYWLPDRVQALAGATVDEKNTQLHHLGEGSRMADIPTDPAAVEKKMDYVVGASILASSRFVKEVGLMCEDYFLYFEEIDWALRGKGRFGLAYAPDSHVFHKVGGSSAKVESAFSLRLLYRNRIKFVARFLPQRLNRTLFDLSWELVRHVLKGRIQQAKLLGRVLLDRRQLIAEGRGKTPA